MTFIQKPNLPDKKIRRLFCADNISEEIEQNLKRLDVTPIKLAGLDIFSEPVRNHPDMLCFHIGDTRWIFYKGVYEKNKTEIDKLNIDIVLDSDPPNGIYPNDIGLNAAAIGDYLVCNKKYARSLIFDKYAGDKTIIDVKQGYAKCSVCIVDEKSVITADIGIYTKCIQNKIDALLIESGHIDLHGYDYGFIGGCAGLIDKKKLAFTGNIEIHPDYNKIKNFCTEKGVEIISLSKERLYDYGGLLPIDYINI